MPNNGDKKWESKTYTKSELEKVAGRYDTTPKDVLTSGIASFILGQIKKLTPLGLLYFAFSMGNAAYAMQKKAQLEKIINRTKDGASVTIQYEYRYISQGKNKQGWVPTGEIRVV